MIFWVLVSAIFVIIFAYYFIGKEVSVIEKEINESKKSLFLRRFK